MKKSEKNERIRDKVLVSIPASIPDLYPRARGMHRHFVLHVGPTNSGKTHSAMEALRASDSGVYLAPLRLLAYEQYERLNADGFLCSMITGEEQLEVESAKYCASTIEMLNIDQKYDCAVIDEAQMIADRDRGGAWTTAILGICAKTVHVCMAPQAEGIVKKLIEECGDSYEVVAHERLTSLEYSSGEDSVTAHVQKGDALIVFSRRSVHALAAELQRKNIRCSIIYGRLPYDVRHREAEKFATGETDVLVATDAIGMGMNLPIRRVLFYERQKFDGNQVRPLNASEIQQIAGRAGRAGIYDRGYAFDFFGGKDRFRNKEKLNSTVPEITSAVLEFPRSLLNVDCLLSEAISAWSKMDPGTLYKKEKTERMIWLCKSLERFISDKEMIYRFLMIPFAENDVDLLGIWLSMANAEKNGKILEFSKVKTWYPQENVTAEDMQRLEKCYQICDLYYHYCRVFGHLSCAEPAVKTRAEISRFIREILDQQKLAQRKCKSCGKKLPWNYQYGYCEKCYRSNFDWYW